MGSRLMCSTPTYDTPSEQSSNSQAWTEDSVNEWAFADCHNPESGTFDNNFFIIGDLIQFPLTPSFERSELSYSFDTDPYNQYPLNASYSQHGSALSSHQSDFTSDVNSSVNILVDNGPDSVSTVTHIDPGLSLQNEKVASMTRKSEDELPTPKKRGRKPRGPFTPAE